MNETLLQAFDEALCALEAHLADCLGKRTCSDSLELEKALIELTLRLILVTDQVEIVKGLLSEKKEYAGYQSRH